MSPHNPQTSNSFADLAAHYRTRIHPNDLRFTLRTLARLRRMAHKLNAKLLAEVLVPDALSRGDLRALETYLGDIVEYAKDLTPKRHCATCGDELDSAFSYMRSDACYCSRRCRQKAYRKRVTARASPATIEPSQRDASLVTGSNLSVTPPDMAATVEVRS
jgi:hypothetical protein